MAEIDIERRPRRSGWTWLALLLVLVGVAVGAWLVFGGGTAETATTPAAEVSPPPAGATEPLEEDPAAGLPQVDLAPDVQPPERSAQPEPEAGGGGR